MLPSLDFSDALLAAKAGHRISRTGWNGKGMWVVLSPGYTRAIRTEMGDNVRDFRAHLLLRDVEGKYVPWLASQTDILAEDWLDLDK